MKFKNENVENKFSLDINEQLTQVTLQCDKL